MSAPPRSRMSLDDARAARQLIADAIRRAEEARVLLGVNPLEDCLDQALRCLQVAGYHAAAEVAAAKEKCT